MNLSFPRESSPRERRGFTLIEMLVVIAIIGILAAILFPVFGKVREGARTSTCSNNMKQLGLAFRQYLTDNGGRFPRTGAYSIWDNGGAWVTGTKNAALANLSTQKPEPDGCTATSTPPCNTARVEGGSIYSYVRSPVIYVCPSNPDGALKRLSYSMNCALDSMGEVRVKTPTEVVLLVDEEKANDGYFFATGDPDDKASYPYGILLNGKSTDKLSELHNGGGNLLFVDGHVKFYPFKTFPLDDTKAGWANKASKTNVPRFHEASFGPYGSYAPLNVSNDSCAVKLSAAPATPAGP